MLSKKDNEILCRVGPGTPMGNLMRQYWIPAFVSSGAGGRRLAATHPPAGRGPHRLPRHGRQRRRGRRELPPPRLLDDLRPQRGGRRALRLPRLEVRLHRRLRRHAQRGLRQQLQGQGEDQGLQDRRSATASSGSTWARASSRRRCPSSRSTWYGAPQRAGTPFKYVRQCNWAQALEGDIDSVHINFLHSRLNVAEPGYDVMDSTRTRTSRSSTRTTATSSAPAVRRRRPLLWRINHFAMPFYTRLHDSGGGGKVWMPDRRLQHADHGVEPVAPGRHAARLRRPPEACRQRASPGATSRTTT